MPHENSLQSFTYRYSSTHLIAEKYEFNLVKKYICLVCN